MGGEMIATIRDEILEQEELTRLDDDVRKMIQQASQEEVKSSGS